ncbi:hypothetical protein CC79DRAFT_525127 [Sarocladium strictum]
MTVTTINQYHPHHEVHPPPIHPILQRNRRKVVLAKLSATPIQIPKPCPVHSLALHSHPSFPCPGSFPTPVAPNSPTGRMHYQRYTSPTCLHRNHHCHLRFHIHIHITILFTIPPATVAFFLANITPRILSIRLATELLSTFNASILDDLRNPGW